MQAWTESQVGALVALANGVIPADERDAGAAEVQAGQRLAEQAAIGVNAGIYRDGVAAAEALATELFELSVSRLASGAVDQLMVALKSRAPGFYKQLRTDVAALYLSDTGVWERIGFPGPSTAQGGYPDFNQPQRKREE
jgi:hypothetical protein